MKISEETKRKLLSQTPLLEKLAVQGAIELFEKLTPEMYLKLTFGEKLALHMLNEGIKDMQREELENRAEQ